MSGSVLDRGVLTFALLFARMPYMSTITLTSKNQVTLPAWLVREKNYKQGIKFQARLQGDDIVLSPKKDLEQIVRDMNEHLRPLIRKPLSDQELQESLHNWPVKR